jgi:hypothetical protein
VLYATIPAAIFKKALAQSPALGAR